MQKLATTFIADSNATGLYVCAVCGLPLFRADKKFDARCGFPSFYLHVDDNVKQAPLSTYGRNRIQLLCNRCGAHLGHLFPHNQTPTGVRYCIAKEAIVLKDEWPSPTIYSLNMPTTNTPEECLQRIREHRSSESNFDTLCQILHEAKEAAQKEGNATLADALQEINDKHAAEYQKAKEAGGTAWPEFEKFVTHFERALGNAKKEAQP